MAGGSCAHLLQRRFFLHNFNNGNPRKTDYGRSAPNADCASMRDWNVYSIFRVAVGKACRLKSCDPRDRRHIVLSGMPVRACGYRAACDSLRKKSKGGNNNINRRNDGCRIFRRRLHRQAHGANSERGFLYAARNFRNIYAARLRLSVQGIPKSRSSNIRAANARLARYHSDSCCNG